ncbi:hypothetical protein JMN32_14185 [Fulvivirga sp. 29W222]|uniref:Two component regulator three Y domain-containing protein n=1 Tax=Fulvivirga marina TaxID=2494733 RepID=A0A937FYR6_9BACT|nr:triple tyrosine motif-containing protein [Fulvivirga marina]MBL6447463.1 hypothetical protein [Fulvivirga marina]
MKKFFLIQLLLPLFIFCEAQDGDFYLTHYSPTGSRVDNVNFDIVQDHRGIICIANRAGILTFDGKNWDFSKTPSAIFSLAISKDNVIYAGGRNGFGQLNRDANFDLSYVSLSDPLPEAKDIFTILIQGNSLYAINETHIFVYNIENGNSTKISPRYSGKLINLLSFEGNVYVTTTNSGMQRIEGTKLMNPTNQAIKNLEPNFICTGPGGKNHLISTVEHKLYLYSQNKLKPIKISNDQGYLAESGIQEGIWFSDSLAAISTLKGGIVFIDPVKGEIKEIINYQTGLPDDEIFALSIDQNFGIWAAHAVGLTRISPAFPFKNFNRYPGLNGKMLSARNHKGKLYVGTSLGVYFLDEVRNYNETVHYVEVPEAPNKEVEVATEEPDSKSRGIFSFLKRDRDRKDNDIKSSKKSEKSSSPVFQAQIKRELQSIKYKFQKIEGIESKTFQFTSVGNRLFCGGLDGLFEITNGEAVPISKLPIRYFYISKNHGKIFTSTYTDELKVFDYSSEGLPELEVFGDYKDYVQHIFEDHQNRIWFCSTNDLYWIKLRGDQITEMDEYHIENPYFYETYGAASGDSILFINESGIYTARESDKSLVKIKSTSNVDRYLAGADGKVWIHTDQKWSTLAQEKTSHKLNLLSLFKNINYITADNSEDYWVITDNNDLYKLTDPNQSAIPNGYELYLKDIRTNSDVLPPSPKLVFDQQNSNLIFEFVQPEYSGVLDIQYSYKLDGLNTQWSEWSSNYNEINFPYLPEGEYTLRVKSRNTLGRINQAAPVTFKVIPPYWKRAWFYALEFLALALLLFISVKLKKLDNKYRLVSKLLAVLTLIIIIEFIQTVAENEFGSQSSPVLDFIMQVLIALIILPFEGVLRKYIFKGNNVKVSDVIKIRNKQVNPKTK